MCGIWGAFGPSVTEADLKYMEALKARGPEKAERVFLNNIGCLGFTRLAINGLTDAGVQPIPYTVGFDGEKPILILSVTNGEIYNWRALAAEHGIECKTGSDCEVVAPLYEAFAKRNDIAGFFNALDGVFAMIIYDQKRNQIVVGRDPFGVRPLYMAHSVKDNTTFFSSELKGLPSRDETFIYDAFPPGHYMIYSATTVDHIQTNPYFKLSHTTLPAFYTVDAASAAVRAALEAAVKKRMMTERPVAALLSGGIDSSLIASLVAKSLKEAGAPPLKTFSIGMAGSSDLAYAKKVADWIGSDHHEIIVTADTMYSAIDDVIRSIESYDTTTVRASVGNWLVSKEIRAQTDCKVIFNGDGSDEVFGSYLYFYNAPSDVEYAAEVQRLLNEIHYFDVLRSDRSISSHGLEPRTPFLDKAFVQTVLSIPIQFRRPSAALPEKWLLRRAFDDGVTLPRDVLWRRKEAFSDGVSGQEKSWYQITQEKAAAEAPVTWPSASVSLYSKNQPRTPEMYKYRSTCEMFYGRERASVNVPHFWMPKWCGNATDPSARTLAVYGSQQN